MLVLRVGSSRPAALLSAALRQEHGFMVECARSYSDALDFLPRYAFDLVVADLRLPDVPAHELVRMLRAAEFNMPVIVVAEGAVASADKVRALDQGADDVVAGSCDTEEFLARVRAVVRRCQGFASSPLRIGPMELVPDAREFRMYGRSVRLSPREWTVLEFLFGKRGKVVEKDAILDHLYGSLDCPEKKTVDVLVHRLRQKLAKVGAVDVIETVWGFGFTINEPEPLPVHRQNVA